MFFLEGVTGKAPASYLQFLLCREFGWTYRDLEGQPAHFINDMLDTLLVVRSVERKRHA